MATVYKFELVTGRHYIRDGEYIEAAKPGDTPVILESGDRMDQIYGNAKFRMVGEVPAPAPALADDEKKATKK